jgi:hypothetical protein
MRYVSILSRTAAFLVGAFLVVFGLLAAGGWTECDKGDCGAVGETVWSLYRALAWPTLAAVLVAAVGIVVVLVRRVSR